MSNDFICDICRKKVRPWQFWRKGIKCIVRIKDNYWIEYYHIDCLTKKNLARKKTFTS